MGPGHWNHSDPCDKAAHPWVSPEKLRKDRGRKDTTTNCRVGAKSQTQAGWDKETRGKGRGRVTRWNKQDWDG